MKNRFLQILEIKRKDGKGINRLLEIPFIGTPLLLITEFILLLIWIITYPFWKIHENIES